MMIGGHMKVAKPYITFTIDSGYGESRFTRKFQDAEFALSYLSGYLGQAPSRITDFEVEWDWEEA
jgi:hypothetical protein